jgi:hypothetical protein
MVAISLGAARDKAPSSWIKLALRLDVLCVVSCCVAVCALRVCVVIHCWFMASLIQIQSHFEPPVKTTEKPTKQPRVVQEIVAVRDTFGWSRTDA